MVAIILTWLLAIGLYTPIFVQLYKSRWESVDYTHAYFVLPVSLGIVIWKREQLKKIIQENLPISLRSNIGYFLVFLLGVLMFVFGWRQDYLLISSLSLIPFLFGITGFLYGSKLCKALLFPILYLLLLVPPPLGVLDSITIPMRYWITVLCELALKAMRFPIVRDGLLLSINKHEIYMGAPCSGFRSLITIIALGLIYVYVIKGRVKKKALLLASVIPLALVGNFLRVLGMCLVTYYFGDAVGQKYHDISGYVIFVVLILAMMGIDSWLEKLLSKNMPQ